jgi:type I site-specific restriction endonuclease
VKAIESVEAALEKHCRDLMLAMATGTGKTFTIAALLYRILTFGCGDFLRGLFGSRSR